MSEAVTAILLGTVDPTVSLAGWPVPAMTTMLYRVCDNDPARFEEATRLVRLFIAAAALQRTKETGDEG
jgi:hypothetical protein